MILQLNQYEIQQALMEFMQKRCATPIRLTAFDVKGMRSDAGYTANIEIEFEDVTYADPVPKVGATTVPTVTKEPVEEKPAPTKKQPIKEKEPELVPAEPVEEDIPTSSSTGKGYLSVIERKRKMMETPKAKTYEEGEKWCEEHSYDWHNMSSDLVWREYQILSTLISDKTKILILEIAETMKNAGESKEHYIQACWAKAEYDAMPELYKRIFSLNITAPQGLSGFEYSRNWWLTEDNFEELHTAVREYTDYERKFPDRFVFPDCAGNHYYEPVPPYEELTQEQITSLLEKKRISFKSKYESNVIGQPVLPEEIKEKYGKIYLLGYEKSAKDFIDRFGSHGVCATNV